MRKLLILLTILLSPPLILAAPTETFWYKFDNTLTDETGTADLTFNQSTTFTTGKIGNSLYLTQYTSEASTNTTTFTGNENYWVTLWANPDSSYFTTPSSDTMFIGFGIVCEPSTSCDPAPNNPNNGRSINLGINRDYIPNELSQWVNFFDLSQLSNDINPNAAEWHHYAYIYNKTTQNTTFYYDGIKSNTKYNINPYGVILNLTKQRLTIGQNPPYISLLGKIDDVRIGIGTNINQTHISLIYNNSNGTTASLNDLMSTCTPNWTCSFYGECQFNNQQTCNGATDTNTCGQQYTGNLSEFPPQNCTYTPPVTGYVPSYSALDIPNIVIDKGLKTFTILITFSTIIILLGTIAIGRLIFKN